jgi:hypothetical protein
MQCQAICSRLSATAGGTYTYSNQYYGFCFMTLLSAWGNVGIGDKAPDNDAGCDNVLAYLNAVRR